MNPTTPRFGAFSSSIDPQQLGTTVIAAAKFVAGILVGLGVITLADKTTILAQVPQLVTDVVALAPIAYAMWHSGEVLFGVFQKVIVRLTQKKALPAPVQAVQSV